MKKYILFCLAIFLLLSGFAYAGGNALAYKRVGELPVLAAGSVAAGDVVPILDTSTGKVKKIDATALPFDGTFDGAIGGTTPAAGAFTTVDASGNMTLDDGVTDSPSLTLTDATDETAVLLKLDTGFATFTTDATDGFNVLVGNFKIGNGTPGLTLGGEDAYVEGTFEVDGIAQFDGTIDANGAITGDGGAALSGMLQAQVASTTASLTIAQCGSTIVSDSADVQVLPEASTALGCQYTFVCGTADDFDIDPADGTDVIGITGSITGANTTTVIAPSAGDAVRCTDIGASATLEAVGANLWAFVGTTNGIWTDVN